MDDWRRKIDEIDRQLVALLNERMKCAIEIGKIKKELGIEIYSPEREAEVMMNVANANNGPLCQDAISQLFRMIIEETKTIEKIC